jgi:hypothetical protein
MGLTNANEGPQQGALPKAMRVMGIPEEVADIYRHRVTGDRCILLSVHCDDSAAIDRALHVLRSTAAEEVDIGLAADPISGRPHR